MKNTTAPSGCGPLEISRRTIITTTRKNAPKKPKKIFTLPASR